MDTGCMIDGAWLQSLANNGKADEALGLSAKEVLVKEFVDYYVSYFGLDR